MKKIYFRADAGPNIGYGHFVRSLALADMLKDDFDCYFSTIHPTEYQLAEIAKICQYLPIPADKSNYDYFLSLLTGDEIVVLDNYFFTTEYQQAIKAKGCKLVCIDDMHDKHYVADVVINHGLTDTSLFDVEPYTRLCLGLGWALLRKPFLEAKPLQIREQGHAVVAFGGVDYYNLTTKVAAILNKQPGVAKITAVVGDANKYIHEISAISKVEIVKNLSAEDVADLFCRAEFAVLPASTIMIEALSCNLPVISGYYVDNQKEGYELAEKEGNFVGIGNFNEEKNIDKISFVLDRIKSVNMPFGSIKCKYINLFKNLFC